MRSGTPAQALGITHLYLHLAVIGSWEDLGSFSVGHPGPCWIGHPGLRVGRPGWVSILDRPSWIGHLWLGVSCWVHRLVHLLVHLLELHLRLRVSTSFTESELNTFSLSARHPLFVSNRTISAISTIFRYRAPTMIIFTLHKNTAISSQTTYVFPSPIQLVIQNISLS